MKQIWSGCLRKSCMEPSEKKGIPLDKLDRTTGCSWAECGDLKAGPSWPGHLLGRCVQEVAQDEWYNRAWTGPLNAVPLVKPGETVTGACVRAVQTPTPNGNCGRQWNRSEVVVCEKAAWNHLRRKEYHLIN